MKRVSSTKRAATPTKRSATPTKKTKQKSITSFFSSSRTPSRSTTPSKPSLKASPAKRPTPTRQPPPTEPDSPPPTQLEPDASPVQSVATDPDAVPTPRRPLDVAPKPPTKRRRLIFEDDDDDDEEDDDAPLIASSVGSNTPTVKAATAADRLTAPFSHRRPKAVHTPRAVPSTYRDPSPPVLDTGADDQMVPSSHAQLDMLRRGARPSQPPGTSEPPMSPGRAALREKLMELVGVVPVGQEEKGWCERHSWTTKIRDAKKRTPDDPLYDPSTLFVPAYALDERKGTKDGGLSPFQRQFWNIKKDNYDVIVFFKKGKFYELYDVDADVGNKELSLNFTKGGRVDMRCCGVPEQAFEKHTARLLDFGYKVGQVEQTETATAAEKRKTKGGNKSSVCERTLLRILTKATAREDTMLRDHRARYVLAVAEGVQENPAPSDSDRSTIVEEGQGTTQQSETRTMGIAYIDVASGGIHIHQYEDDSRLSQTERMVTFLAPKQLVADMTTCSDPLSNILKWTERRDSVAVDDLGKKKGMPMMTKARLAKYLDNEDSPLESRKQFKRVSAHMERYKVSCRAFGGLVAHLKSLIIDVENLSIGNYSLEPNPEASGDVEMKEANDVASRERLRMDASTLQNLEVLSSNSAGGEKNSLLSFIDKAHTPAGRRLLRKWLAEPLVCSVDIEDRLQAVDDLHTVEELDGGQSLNGVIKQLKTKKDLERALPKLHQFATVSNGAVMFDDTNQRRVREFVQVLRSIRSCLHGLESLAETMEQTQPRSKRLQKLLTLGECVPHDAIDKLDFFLGKAFDVREAENEGLISPKAGAVPEYDTARNALKEVEAGLEDEIQTWRGKLHDPSIKWYHRGKEPFQIEVRLETLRRRSTPPEFEVVSESKTAKRFYTNRVRSLVRDHVDVSEVHDDASSMVAREIVKRFDQDFATWAAVSATCAEVDALIGLARASRDDGSGPMVRPTILPNEHGTATFSAKGLRHPILAAQSDGFVANDVGLGGEAGDDPAAMILTGPNAGGKSTLARQVGLAVVLAQTGCYVPASSLTLRPFADVFVRMGASDDLARGRSTFMVEMEEVSNMLNRATARSLIIADEVGRGTSTHDGYAVAFAALDYMRRVSRALTIFSTHYSQLGAEMRARCERDGGPCADVFEMAAEVDERRKRITFLYKLRRGASAHSRGIYCARVARVDGAVADEAERAAREFDEKLAGDLEQSRFERLIKGLDGPMAERCLEEA